MRLFIFLLFLSSELYQSPNDHPDDHAVTESWRETILSSVQYAVRCFRKPDESSRENGSVAVCGNVTGDLYCFSTLSSHETSGIASGFNYASVIKIAHSRMSTVTQLSSRVLNAATEAYWYIAETLFIKASVAVLITEKDDIRKLGDINEVLIISGNPIRPRHPGPREVHPRDAICTDALSCSKVFEEIDIDGIPSTDAVSYLEFIYNQVTSKATGLCTSVAEAVFCCDMVTAWDRAAHPYHRIARSRSSPVITKSESNFSAIVPSIIEKDDILKLDDDLNDVSIISGNPVRPRRQGPRGINPRGTICTDSVSCSKVLAEISPDGIPSKDAVSSCIRFPYNHLASTATRLYTSLVSAINSDRGVVQKSWTYLTNLIIRIWSSAVSTYVTVYGSATEIYLSTHDSLLSVRVMLLNSANWEHSVTNVYFAIERASTYAYFLSEYRVDNAYFAVERAITYAYLTAEYGVENAYFAVESAITNAYLVAQDDITTIYTSIQDLYAVMDCPVIPILDSIYAVWTTPANLFALLRQWRNRHLVASDVLTRTVWKNLLVWWQPLVMFKYALLSITLICACLLLCSNGIRTPEHKPRVGKIETFPACRSAINTMTASQSLDRDTLLTHEKTITEQEKVNMVIQPGRLLPKTNPPGHLPARTHLYDKYTEVCVLPGTFGSIFIVTAPESQHLYALKFNSDNKRKHGISEVGNMRLEIKMLAHLRHTNIVKMVDADYNANSFLLLRFFENRDLRSFYNQYSLPLYLKYRVLIGIASAIAYVHTMHYAHRSIRPGHVLLDGQVVPHLCGFGYSSYCLCEDGQSPLLQNERRNTFAYSPAETLVSHNTQRADIYSLGATFYYILFERDLFKGIPFIQRVLVCSGVDTLPAYACEKAEAMGLLKLIGRMVSYQPEQRPNASEVLHIVLETIEL